MTLPGKSEEGIGIDMRREGVGFSMEIGHFFVALLSVLFGADPSDRNRYTYFYHPI